MQRGQKWVRIGCSRDCCLQPLQCVSGLPRGHVAFATRTPSLLCSKCNSLECRALRAAAQHERRPKPRLHSQPPTARLRALGTRRGKAQNSVADFFSAIKKQFLDRRKMHARRTGLTALLISTLAVITNASIQNTTCPEVCKDHACSACLPNNFVCSEDFTQTQCLAHPDWCWCGGTNYECDVRTYQCVPSAGGTFPSMATCTAKCGIQCPPWSQLFDGYCYAVMDQHNKTNQGGATGPGETQSVWIALPSGWEVAPSVQGLGPALYSALGQGKYAWGTNYLVYSTRCENPDHIIDSFSATWAGSEISCPGPNKGVTFRLETNTSENGTFVYKTACTANETVWGSKVVMRIPSVDVGLSQGGN
jgi:hypothetical protein